jgi:hypothetical protein
MINADIEKSAPAKAARAPRQQTTQPADATGACIYMAGSRTKCELLTRPECQQLSGIWLPERDCSKILKMELGAGTAARAGRSSAQSGK